VPRHIYYLNVREYRRCNQNRTIQRNWQHWVHKTKKNKTQHNPEKLATLGTQDKGKQNTTQPRETGNIYKMEQLLTPRPSARRPKPMVSR
jgi:hypothetical protein